MHTLRLFLTVILVALGFAACDSSVSSMADAEMNVAAPAAETTSPSIASKADDGATVHRNYVRSFFYSPCAGELISLEGEFQYVIRSGPSSGNGGFHTVERFTQTLHGIGLGSGARYEVRTMASDRANSRLPFGSTVTTTYSFRIIKAGRGLAFKLRTQDHLTVNANGELSVVIDDFTAECLL